MSGGGAKPFKQKGTGRARQGSTRAPHYTGGGVALGPSRAATASGRRARWSSWPCAELSLTGPPQARWLVVEGWDWEVPSTKSSSAALATLGLRGRVMVVLSRRGRGGLQVLPQPLGRRLVLAGELNAYDMLC